MPYQADCADCAWTFDHERQEQVADMLERHARKEHHHVEFVHQSADAPA